MKILKYNLEKIFSFYNFSNKALKKYKNILLINFYLRTVYYLS
jgi:hypothetical protein